MARKKARKSAYIPPENEVVNKRERSVHQRPVRTQRGRRSVVIQPPSWGRVFRRLPFYYIVMVVLLYAFMNEEAREQLTAAERWGLSAMQGLIVTVAFAPFMFFMDRAQYRHFMRRQQEKQAPPRGDDE